ncbi:MAG: dTMP kinase [Candidatus Latescibacterota bacterium]|nr:dTMP kinase [Candidatus Latescibacterota bacterium]
MRGFLITFEGIERCGKTTQSQKLAAGLEEAGHEVLMTREPGGTPLGVAIREILLHQSVGEVDSVAELLLFAGDRAQHIRSLILPALDAGKIVISDRFYDSTRAYQGYGRQIPMDVIDRAIVLATSGLRPDLSVLVDVDVVTSRSRGHEGVDDRIEQASNVFFDRVRQGFLSIAEEEPDRFLTVDGTDTIDVVARVISAEVNARLGAARG